MKGGLVTPSLTCLGSHKTCQKWYQHPVQSCHILDKRSPSLYTKLSIILNTDSSLYFNSNISICSKDVQGRLLHIHSSYISMSKFVYKASMNVYKVNWACLLTESWIFEILLGFLKYLWKQANWQVPGYFS